MPFRVELPPTFHEVVAERRATQVGLWVCSGSATVAEIEQRAARRSAEQSWHEWLGLLESSSEAMFGLDTDAKRFGRLFFQPVLIALSLWCTNALRRRPRRRDR